MASLETSTITFGDRAENHKGMQIIGTPSNSGFSIEELVAASDWFADHGYPGEIYDINALLPADAVDVSPAYLLVVPGGIDAVVDADALMNEQKALTKDTKAFMYGRVVNKKARHNLCFADVPQVANYEAGMGTIMAFPTLPLLNHVRNELPKIFGEKATSLMGEGNYYYDINKCGIGWHGDSERKIVIGIRLGATMPLCYRWFREGKHIGETGRMDMTHGTVYAMSEKAVGTDWRKRLDSKKGPLCTLRHAAGAPSYIK